MTEVRTYEEYKAARDDGGLLAVHPNVSWATADIWAQMYETNKANRVPDTGFIADEAKRIVSGDRNAAYGEPEDDFERIARFWTAYLQNMGLTITLTAANVSPMMRLLKEARLCRNPTHLDSHIDIIGYTLTGARVNGVKKPD